MDKPAKPTVSRNVLLIFMLLVMLGGLCLLLFWAYMLLSPPPLKASGNILPISPAGNLSETSQFVLVFSHIAMFPFFMGMVLNRPSPPHKLREFFEVMLSSVLFYGTVILGHSDLGLFAHNLALFLGDWFGLKTYSVTLFYGASFFAVMQFFAFFFFQPIPYVSDIKARWGKYVKRVSTSE